ncbi:hypothetical protein [Metallibacterium sp.]|jgi:hypothetical protein|nr:hypothetical protein [Metallibacterium sp.]
MSDAGTLYARLDSAATLDQRASGFHVEPREMPEVAVVYAMHPMSMQ